MDGFLAICLTVIFAAWVWYLKHQLADAADRLAGAPHGHLVHHPHVAAMPNADGAGGDAAEPATDGSGYVRERGVKTWVIA